MSQSGHRLPTGSMPGAPITQIMGDSGGFPATPDVSGIVVFRGEQLNGDPGRLRIENELVSPNNTVHFTFNDSIAGGLLVGASAPDQPNWYIPTSPNGTITFITGENTIDFKTSGIVINTVTAVVTTPYVVNVATAYCLLVDASAMAITVRLPDNALFDGRTFVIKDSTGSAGTNAITVTTVSGLANIDAATTFVMNTNYQSVTVMYVASNYIIV